MYGLKALRIPRTVAFLIKLSNFLKTSFYTEAKREHDQKAALSSKKK